MSVYFAQDSKNGWIKIGCSKDPEKRIKHIPSDKGHIVDNLKLLKVVGGSFDEEKFCQRLLAKHGVNDALFDREWFYPTDEVLSLAGKSVEWLEKLFELRNDADKKYRYRVKYSFDGDKVTAEPK